MNKIISIQNKIKERIVLFALLGIIAIMFFLIDFFSEATFDTGDGLRHYFISRYSWKHPELFLDSWGKPFFTLVSSPFSQFGLLGANVFNILCAVIASYFCFLIAKKLHLKYPFTVIFLLCFSSIYFPTLNSGLTEPFFSLILILPVYLMFEEKYLTASAIVSLLPYVRSEGYLVLPLFFLALLYKRKLFSIPFLALGTVAYTLVGYFYFDDILWIKNHNPYTGQNGDIYGHGPLLHFVKQYANIFGKPLTVLILAGMAFLFYKIFFLRPKESQEEKKYFPEELILVYGSAVVVFAAHSVFWWKGIVGSLGLIRVMAGIVPVAALIGLRGLNFIFIPLEKIKSFWITSLMIMVVLFFIIRNPFAQEYFPYRMHPEQPVIKAAGEWIENSEYKNEKIYFLHPFLPFVLSVDPFDQNKDAELWGLYDGIEKFGLDVIPRKSLIVWDAHYAANEGRLDLDKISSDTNFRLLKTFRPQEEFETLGGNKFMVCVFSREKSLQQRSVVQNKYDFESPGIYDNLRSEEKSYSGKFSYKGSANSEYCLNTDIDLSKYSELNQISIKAKVFSAAKLKNVLCVVQIDNSEGKMLSWVSKPVTNGKNNSWEDFEAEFFPSSEFIAKGNKLKLYIWNPKQETFYIDDFQIAIN